MAKTYMMKVLFSIWSLLFCQLAFSQSQQGVDIILKVDARYAHQKIKIYQEWPHRRILDTLTLQQGVHKITVGDSVPFVGQIFVLSKPLVFRYFVAEKEPVTINLGVDTVSVVAGKANAVFQAYSESKKIQDQEMSKIGRAYTQETDLEKKIAIGKQTNELFARNSTNVTDFVLAHINTVYGQWIAASNAGILQLDDLLKIQQQLGNDIQYAAVNARLQQQINNKTAGLKIGQHVPGFTLFSADGKQVALADVLSKNRYVLLDFWASWCVPCRAKNRNITPIYEELKKKGIEVVSISVDKQESLWRKAVKDDKLSWIQLRAEGELKSPVVEAYRVRSLPSTFLVDREGKILKMGVDDKDLLTLE